MVDLERAGYPALGGCKILKVISTVMNSEHVNIAEHRTARNEVSKKNKTKP